MVLSEIDLHPEDSMKTFTELGPTLHVVRVLATSVKAMRLERK